MNSVNRYETKLKAVFLKLVKMCRDTESAIEKSITALKERNSDLARSVISDDVIIDEEERDIERDCLNILLLEHPVAGDFRYVSAALKMITDLERIADQASDISELSLQFGDEFIKEPLHIETMSKIVINMVKDGVQSYINKDTETAKSLDKADDKVDELFAIIKNELIEIIKKDPSKAEQALLFMMIAKYLERIGDHAVNIGEWEMYAETGRHDAV